MLLAIDRAGWANLVRLLTAGRRRCDKGQSLVDWSEICRYNAGLVALWSDLLDGERDPPASLIADLRDAYGDRIYAVLARHRESDDVPREARLHARARAARIPLVAATEVLYHSRGRRPLQDVLTCIRHGVTLATAGRLIRPNDEHDLRAAYTFGRLYADEVAAVARTLDVAARCTFDLGALRYRYPSERLPDGSTSAEFLRRLVAEGAAWSPRRRRPRRGSRTARPRARGDRGARLSRLLPDDVRDRRRSAGAATSCVRAAARRRTRRFATASASPPSTR